MKKGQKKTVVITGGTKGIGASITRFFYDQGMYVVIGARQDNGLAKKLGSRARFVSIDVKKESGHIKLVTTAKRFTGKINVYVNCAGFSKWKPIGKVDNKFLNEMMDTNLKGTFWGCKTAAKYLSKGGSIINISSLAGKRGSSNNSVYCASKFGVIGLTQSLAKELGGRGIRVNAVCPVYVQTKGVLDALKDKASPAQGRNVQAYLKKFTKEQTALKVLPKGEDVAQMCLFLASEAATAITGQSINVDCGVLPQ